LALTWKCAAEDYYYYYYYYSRSSHSISTVRQPLVGQRSLIIGASRWKTHHNR
jgi:hypothetical protein